LFVYNRWFLKIPVEMVPHPLSFPLELFIKLFFISIFLKRKYLLRFISIKDKNFTEKNMKITFKIKRKKDEIKYIYSHSQQKLQKN
tara:strand:- start:13477 stop:13734 length:258 start_codon:yes stop_codon:yes gene_type:complete